VPDLSLSMTEDVERRLQERYKPVYLDVEDQAGNCGGGKIAIVMAAEAFRGQTRLNRQRDVQALFAKDIESGRIHALSANVKTPEEYHKLLEQQSKKP